MPYPTLSRHPYAIPIPHPPSTILHPEPSPLLISISIPRLSPIPIPIPIQTPQPIERGQRIHRLLGIDRKRAKELKAEGEEGIVAEMMVHHSSSVRQLEPNRRPCVSWDRPGGPASAEIDPKALRQLELNLRRVAYPPPWYESPPRAMPRCAARLRHTDGIVCMRVP